MKRCYTYLFLLFACLLLLLACEQDDFSTNSKHTLSFSRDTLMLDTIFTGTATSTYMLKVYNRNKQPLLISSVLLANAANSGFRINVDGAKGTSFSDIEIKGKDSLHIFVEATVDVTQTNEPFLVKDSILFLTNGVQQDIKLRVYGQNVEIFRGKVIAADTVITAVRPLVIYDSLHIAKDATLTLAAGSRLFFHQGAGLKVYGKLKAEGGISSPVIMRGDRTDKMFDDLPYDRLPGQWEGVRFYNTSFGNSLNYTDIHGGNYGVLCDSSGTDRRKVVITNSRISQISRNALDMTLCQAVIANSEITNAGNNCVKLLGGDYEFTHCTIANYYAWDIRKGTALYLSNGQNDISYPLSMASFRNCVIAGSASDELTGNKSPDNSAPFNYYFSHSLINSTEEEGEEVVNVVWKKDDHFIQLDKTKLIYDFRPDSLSGAINIGLLKDAASYPVDRNGISRVSDAAPDAGCYEWIE